MGTFWKRYDNNFSVETFPECYNTLIALSLYCSLDIIKNDQKKKWNEASQAKILKLAIGS